MKQYIVTLTWKLWILRIIMRIIALILSIPFVMFTNYYISLDVHERSHRIFKKRIYKEPLKFVIPYFTIKPLFKEYRRGFIDIDIADVENVEKAIDQIRTVFPKFRIFYTGDIYRGVHLVTLRKYTHEHLKQLLLQAIPIIGSRKNIDYQIGEAKYFCTGSRISSKYVLQSGKIQDDIHCSTEWRLTDPGIIHVMNIAILLNKGIIRIINIFL